MHVYSVYRMEKDGSTTFICAWPDVWDARHWVLRGEEEKKLPHFIVDQVLTTKTGEGSDSSTSTCT